MIIGRLMGASRPNSFSIPGDYWRIPPNYSDPERLWILSQTEGKVRLRRTPQALNRAGAGQASAGEISY